MRLIAKELVPATSNEPVGDPQANRLYMWEEVDLHLLHKLLPASAMRKLNVDEANQFLAQLAERWNRTVFCVYDDDPAIWSEKPETSLFMYQPGSEQIVFRDPLVCEVQLIREYTHAWLAEAFLFFSGADPKDASSRANCINLLEPHGPIFLEAYILLLTERYEVPEASLKQSAGLWNLVIADCGIEELRKEMLETDVKVFSDSAVQILEKTVRIEHAAYAGGN